MNRECNKCGMLIQSDEMYIFEMPYMLKRDKNDDKWVTLSTGLCWHCSKELAEIVRDYI